MIVKRKNDLKILAEYYSDGITEEQITEQKVKDSVEIYLGTYENINVVKTDGKLEFTITVDGIENKMNLENLSGEAQDEISATTQNEIKDDKYSITYSVPEKFIYKGEYSYDDTKYYEFEGAGYSYIDAKVSIGRYTETEYTQEENGNSSRSNRGDDYIKSSNKSPSFRETRSFTTTDKVSSLGSRMTLYIE